MSVETTTTRHIIDVVVSLPGDADTKQIVEDSIHTGFRMVSGLRTYPHVKPELVTVNVSEPMGDLSGDEYAVVLNDNQTWSSLNGASIRTVDWDDLDGDINDQQMILEL